MSCCPTQPRGSGIRRILASKPPNALRAVSELLSGIRRGFEREGHERCHESRLSVHWTGAPSLGYGPSRAVLVSHVPLRPCCHE
jgi:hypothetical protein